MTSLRILGLVLLSACGSIATTPDAGDPADAAPPADPRAASWDGDHRMTDTPAESVTIYNFGRSVAAAGGRVHAVWHEAGAAEAGGAQVYYARSIDGGDTWQPSIRLSTTGANSTIPTVAADGDRVIAAWSSYDDTTHFSVHLRRSIDGGASWEPEQTLTSSGVSACAPVALSGDRAYVAWNETETPDAPEIYVRRSLDAGASWQPAVKMSDSIASPSWVPTVTAAGDLVFVGWVDYRDANEEEYLRRSTDSGATWGPITRMTDDAADSWAPSIAIAGDDVYFTWFDRRDGSATDVDAEAALDAALSLIGLVPEPAPPRDPAVYYLPLFEQRIAAKLARLQAEAPTWVANGGDPDQLAALTATFEDVYRAWALGWEIYLRRSADRGASWTETTRLTDALGLSARPSVVAVGGEVHLVWFDSRDAATVDAEVYYKASSDRGQTWTADTRLTEATGNSWMASLALDGDRLHVLWSDTRDGNSEIYYKRATLAPP